MTTSGGGNWPFERVGEPPAGGSTFGAGPSDEVDQRREVFRGREWASSPLAIEAEPCHGEVKSHA